MELKAIFTDSKGREHTIWLTKEKQKVSGCVTIDDEYAADMSAGYLNVLLRIGKWLITMDEKIRRRINGEEFPPRKRYLYIGWYRVDDTEYTFYIRRKFIHLEGHAIEHAEGLQERKKTMKILQPTLLKDLGDFFRLVGARWILKETPDERCENGSRST